jgi:hypothetical protein
MRWPLAPLCFATLLAGCAQPFDQYAKVDPAPPSKAKRAAAADPAVLIDANVQIAKPTTTTKAFTDLSDHAQAALAAYAIKRASTKDSASTIGKQLLAITADADKAKDLSKLSLQVVVTVKYGADRLIPEDHADRIDLLAIDLFPEGAIFTSWDQLNTQYASINLGTLTREQDTAFSAELDPTVGAVGGKFIGSATRKNTAALNETPRIIQLNGELSPSMATLFEQGIESRDLTGNIVFNVDLQREQAVEGWLFSAPTLWSGSEPLAASRIKLVASSAKLSSSELHMLMHVHYVLRRALTNYRSRQEYDDKARYDPRDCVEEARFTNLNAPTEVWMNGASIEVAPYVHGKPDTDEEMPLVFATENEAEEFVAWLRRAGTGRLANYALLDGGGHVLGRIGAASLVLQSYETPRNAFLPNRKYIGAPEAWQHLDTCPGAQDSVRPAS